MKSITSASFVDTNEVKEEYKKTKRKLSCYYEDLDEKIFDKNEKNYNKNITLEKKEELEYKLEELGLEKSKIDFEA